MRAGVWARGAACVCRVAPAASVSSCLYRSIDRQPPRGSSVDCRVVYSCYVYVSCRGVACKRGRDLHQKSPLLGVRPDARHRPPSGSAPDQEKPAASLSVRCVFSLLHCRWRARALHCMSVPRSRLSCSGRLRRRVWLRPRWVVAATRGTRRWPARAPAHRCACCPPAARRCRCASRGTPRVRWRASHAEECFMRMRMCLPRIETSTTRCLLERAGFQRTGSS